MRLNKFLAAAGIASRRAADEIIRQGRVVVNGTKVTEMGMQVDENKDVVRVDSKLVHIVRKHIYILLNKPKDVITTAKDERGRQTVLDMVDIDERVFPVGRLDAKSEGLILLTNDGEVAQRLQHPRFNVKKIYRVRLDRPFLPEDMDTLTSGIELEDGPTLPCQARYWGDRPDQVEIMMREGRNRQVRRMFEALGYETKRLKRMQMGPLRVKGLKRGEWRHLSQTERHILHQAVGLEKQTPRTNKSEPRPKRSPKRKY